MTPGEILTAIAAALIGAAGALGAVKMANARSAKNTADQTIAAFRSGTKRWMALLETAMNDVGGPVENTARDAFRRTAADLQTEVDIAFYGTPALGEGAATFPSVRTLREMADFDPVALELRSTAEKAVELRAFLTGLTREIEVCLSRPDTVPPDRVTTLRACVKHSEMVRNSFTRSIVR